MSYLIALYDFMQSPAGAGVLLALLAMSEALAAIPSVKANSVFQLVSGLLERLKKQPAPVV